MKPQVLAATERAMARKLFDRIGLVTGRSTGPRGDPIVVGQIIDPRHKGQWNEKVVTFFVAWWLNTTDL